MSEHTHRLSHTVKPEESGQRLDHIMMLVFEDKVHSRSRLKACTKELTLNGKAAKLSTAAKNGDCIEAVFSFTPPPEKASASNIPLDIIYDDDDIIVINKPPGMTTHPAKGNWDNTLVNALVYLYKNLPSTDAFRPGIVHRLDKDTSGLIVCAKSAAAFTRLARAFHDREVEKEYTAIVKGRPRKANAIIEAPIGRHPQQRKKFTVTEKGRYARSEYWVLESFANHALVKVRIDTGRTHQIRVHMNHIGNPILGDPIYSRPDMLSDKLCLAATSLSFTHPLSGEICSYSIELPAHMQAVLGLLKS